MKGWEEEECENLFYLSQGEAKKAKACGEGVVSVGGEIVFLLILIYKREKSKAKCHGEGMYGNMRNGKLMNERMGGRRVWRLILPLART